MPRSPLANDVISTIRSYRRNAQRAPVRKPGRVNAGRVATAVRHGLCAERLSSLSKMSRTTKNLNRPSLQTTRRDGRGTRIGPQIGVSPLRIRRATSIDTDLMRLQVEYCASIGMSGSSRRSPKLPYRVLQGGHGPERENDTKTTEAMILAPWVIRMTRLPLNALSRRLPRSDTFLQRLTNLDNGAFDRLGRYESALWRQVVQLLFVLSVTRPSLNTAR